MFVRDHAHAYIVRRTVILYMEIPPIPSTLGSPQSLRPSSIVGTIITQQKGLTDIYYLCSPSPLHRVAPSSSQKIGASLLIYLHIYICCKWKITKKKTKTKQTINTCTANAFEKKKNPRKENTCTHCTHCSVHACAFPVHASIRHVAHKCT